MFLGGHEQYGEDGMMIVADKAIGRDDYGQPQCSFRKRTNSNSGGCDPLPSLFGGWRQPRGPQSLEGPWWSRIFKQNRRQKNRRLSKSRQSRLRKRIGLAIRQGRDVTFTNDIALIKLRHRIQLKVSQSSLLNLVLDQGSQILSILKIGFQLQLVPKLLVFYHFDYLM